MSNKTYTYFNGDREVEADTQQLYDGIVDSVQEVFGVDLATFDGAPGLTEMEMIGLLNDFLVDYFQSKEDWED